MAPDSLLFLATDGLTDQIGGERDIAYGKRRLRELLLSRRADSAAHAGQAVLDDLRRWQGEQPRRDDLTFFCFRPCLTMARDASGPLEFEFVPEPQHPGTTVFCIKAISHGQRGRVLVPRRFQLR